jgi:S1-C subfamily serine protease
MKRDLWFRSASSLGLGAAVLLGGRSLLAEPPAVVPVPREAPGAIRDQRDVARDARENVRDIRRARRPFVDLGLNLGRLTERGLAIANLATDSFAYRAGLRSGDYIVSINGHPVQGSNDFDRWAYADTPDGRAKVVVVRNGREEVIYLEPSILYSDAAPAPVDDWGYFGVTLDERYPDRIIARRVLPNTPAYLAGLRDGDEITSWHGERIKSRAELERAIHGVQPGAVDFEYRRGEKEARAEAKFGPREVPRAGVKVEVGR